MAAQLVQKSPQSSAMACADGSISWRLRAGRALTLQPRDAAELLVSQGRIWATVDGPHAGPPFRRRQEVGQFFPPIEQGLLL